MVEEEGVSLSDVEFESGAAAHEASTISRRDQYVNHGFIATSYRQLWVMVKKNTILQVGLHAAMTFIHPVQIRYYKTTAAQAILSPLMFMLLLYILQQIDYAKQRVENRNPPSSILPGVKGCQGPNPGDPCINIMYAAPNDVPKGMYTRDLYDAIMMKFVKINSDRTGDPPLTLEASLSSIVPIPSSDFLYEYVLAHPNTTNWGVIFKCNDSDVANIQYEIWYNASRTLNGTDILGRELISLLRGLDEAIISHLNYPNGELFSNITVTLKDWPVVPQWTLSDGIVQSLGPVFFFCTVMVIFINVINQVLTEKELKLRHAMEMMGLKPFIYWGSHVISQSIVILVASITTVLLGLAFRFKAFVNTDAGVLILIFFLYTEAMVFLAFFITTLIRRARVGVLVGIFIFIVGLLFESFVFSESYLGYVWWTAETPKWIANCLLLLPFFNFGKLFLDITTLTTGKLDTVTSTYVPGPGFAWVALFQPVPTDYLPVYPSGSVPDVPAPIVSIYFLLADIGIYGFLAWYFDNTVPNEYGYFLPPWFFLLPSYWGYEGSKARTISLSSWLKTVLAKSYPGYAIEMEDPDVKSERESCYDARNDSDVKIVNLRKIYKKALYPTKQDKIAVKSLCIAMQKGQVLALLGQNGAGKSTTMNILSGLTQAHSGDAYIFGYSVKNQMSSLRKIMGVCPQHDILFDDLTAKEHILLYAGLKGIPPSSISTLLNERLAAVRLQTDETPAINGLIIAKTTHSMEEADILGDRIAVMSHGRLRAIGSSLALKKKYGAGYRISLVVEPTRSDQAKAAVSKLVPSASLDDDSAGALIYQFSGQAADSIPKFIKYLDENPEGFVKAWGISQTTLEEVFLKLIRDANTEEKKRKSLLELK
ncbi:ATP-binding cassette sub- A member 1 [Phlyctochytrium planicorne]|nr:ATP-binding cassette sub- A member 1 [Phlyctochytrium planicorne]